MIRTKFLEAVLEKMPFLSEAENKESFFRRIATHLPSLDPGYQMIERAYYDTEQAFEGIKRETGEDFFTHLRATCLIRFEYLRKRDSVGSSVCLLHDIVEDTKWTIQMVQARFTAEHALYLSYLTKPTNEEFPNFLNEQLLQVYYSRLASAPRNVWEIKLSDRFHNLITMWSLSPERIARKVEETKRYYLPYAEKYLILLHEIEAAVESLEEELKSLKQKTS